jgi:archaellum biogenesis ATPase FlaH
MRVETIILKHLISNDVYARRVLPFLKGEYFTSSEKKLYQQIAGFYLRYNAPPSLEALSIEISQRKDVSETEHKEVTDIINSFKGPQETSKQEWLLDATEKFCQEKALYNAISKSIMIMDGKDKTQEKTAIPSLLQEALAVCFDPSVGHDYFEDFGLAWEYYHNPIRKVPFDIAMFNTITNGGVSPKTLNIVMAGTGIGKSIWLCHLAAAYIAQGKSVLYVTLEMAEMELRKRIDANLFNLNIDDMLHLPRADYERRVNKLKENFKGGNLIIKEFPTAGASVLHIENLLNELQLKKNFKPDVIMVDYLNIMLSSRVKSGTTGMYQYVKCITEEVRGLAVKYNVPVWSATQVNRSGFGDSDPDMDATSESFGLPMTADLLFVLVSNEQLASLQQIMVKQLKNRYRDENKDRRFVVGLNKDKMQFSDADEGDKNQSQQIILKSETGEREELPWEEYRDRMESAMAARGNTKRPEKASDFKY